MFIFHIFDTPKTVWHLNSQTIFKSLLSFAISNFRVFQLLPGLKLLDGLPKLPGDEQFIDDENSKLGSCSVS